MIDVRLLALVDVSTAGHHVLDQLLYLSDPETGTAAISQNEMARELGASKPTVNRGFKELRGCGLAWSLEDGLYQAPPTADRRRRHRTRPARATASAGATRLGHQAHGDCRHRVYARPRPPGPRRR
ncbi:hypothetical protein [Streptomyces griseoluteus]|uniref:hypothetical protein n=1 Tax=Streptomyces griseoluteus TaxID=29306 RepID=UPI0036F81A29